MADELVAILSSQLPGVVRWAGAVARQLRRHDIAIGGKTSGYASTDALTLADLSIQELLVAALRDMGPRVRACRMQAEETSGAIQLSSERYVEMSAQEQVVLTVSVNGFGKRTSSFEYRTTGRGGKGIVAMSVNDRNGKLVASFPVEDSDQIMLVTDKGQLIRCPVEGIRIAGRSTQGVIVFDTAEDEHVVSVEHIGEDAESGNGNGG